MKRAHYILAISIFIAGLASAEETKKHNYIPGAGYVPDSETAIRIAEAVWLPIYGESIKEKEPFTATLKEGIWIVRGTLPKEYDVGGVPVAEISKENGQIIRVSHGK